jgi:hypothetical protein
MMPPLMTVGSTPPASSSAAIIEVVVVLPCVPPTATVHFRRISSASISARRTTACRLSSAAHFGIAALDRGRVTTTAASPSSRRLWPIITLMPCARSPSTT